MARFNELLGVAARYSRLAARLGGLDEQEGITTIAPELMPVLALEADRFEWRILGGVRSWVVNRTDAAVAAALSHVGVRNPANSGQIVIVEGFEVDPGAAAGDTYSLRSASAVTPDATGETVARDFRSGRPSTQVTDVTNAALQGTLMHQWRELLNESHPRFLHVLLAPGDQILIARGTVNRDCTVSFWGYERAASPMELEDF